MQAGSQDDGRYTDLQAIAAYHRQLRPAYRAFLSTLSLADLDRVSERANRRPITNGWCVGHIAEHESLPPWQIHAVANADEAQGPSTA